MYKNQNLQRILKFGTVGLSGVIVNSGLLSFLTEITGIDYRISAITAIEISILNNFLWNSVWTWRDHEISGFKSLIGRLLKFHLSCIFTAFFVNYGLLILLTEKFGIPYAFSNLIGIATGSLINYLASHFWVFHSRNRNLRQNTETPKNTREHEYQEKTVQNV